MSSRSTPQRASRAEPRTPTSGTRSSRRLANDNGRSPSLQPMPDVSPSGGDTSAKKRKTDKRDDGAKSPGSTTSSLFSTTSAITGDRVRSRNNRPPRPDINMDSRHHRLVNLREDDLGLVPENQEDGERDQPPNRPDRVFADTPDDRQTTKVFVWGTRICVEDVSKQFTKFLTEFKADAPDEDERTLTGTEKTQIVSDEPYYMQRLQEIKETQLPHLSINLQHVRKFNERLYRSILCYPADIIPYLDNATNHLFETDFDDTELECPIEIRPFNAEKTRNMRGLNPEDIDQLITVTGMVIRTSSLIPEMRLGHFVCTVCKEEREVEVDRGRIEEPTVCTNCHNNHCFQLIHNRSQFIDKQIVKLQESPDDMPAGQTPHAITLYGHGTLVDKVQPGDRVTVTGIYRALPLRLNPKMRTVKSVYRTHVDVLHFRKMDALRLHQSDDPDYLSEERKELILGLAEKPDISERLSRALAPSIYEHDDIKKGILCMLFGGSDTKKDTSDHGHFRPEINVLLCGDPGTSKSQLLQYVHNLVPRGQYTSGKGSTAVGLTAYVTRDPETKHFVLQTGALVLSDNGVCCIDEFDKMNDSTRSVLHEVMEQQTLSITKAGIICQLNARTSILAAANPVDSQWNRDKTIVENVQLPHTLLSRFDLIFLLVDPQDELYDRRLATHLVSLYYRKQKEADDENLDMSLIRDYIQYAKKNIMPKIGEEVSQRLIDKYLTMRKVGSGHGQVTAYPRQLESLIRLSEANAKIRLSEEVTVDDVEEAYRLHREALKQSAVDPLTGRVDVNILAAGMSMTTRKHMLELSEVIKARLEQKKGINFNLKNLLQELRDTSERMISREVFDEAINDLCKKDILVLTGDKIRLIQSGTAKSTNEQ